MIPQPTGSTMVAMPNYPPWLLEIADRWKAAPTTEEMRDACRRAVNDHNIRQADLVTLLGVKKNTVHRWVSGDPRSEG